MKLDTQKPGLYALFKPYKAALLKQLYFHTNHLRDDGKGSGYLWTWLEENAEKLGGEKRSRASEINALNDLVDKGILKYKTATGKGGHHRLYSVKLSPGDFEQYVTHIILDKMTSIFKGDWWRHEA